MRFHLKFKSCLIKPTPSFFHLVSGYPVLSNNEDDISGDMRGGVKEMGEVPRQFFGHFDQGFSDHMNLTGSEKSMFGVLSSTLYH